MRKGLFILSQNGANIITNLLVVEKQGDPDAKHSRDRPRFSFMCEHGDDHGRKTPKQQRELGKEPYLVAVLR